MAESMGGMLSPQATHRAQPTAVVAKPAGAVVRVELLDKVSPVATPSAPAAGAYIELIRSAKGIAERVMPSAVPGGRAGLLVTSEHERVCNVNLFYP